jgi:hypothetical protein
MRFAIFQIFLSPAARCRNILAPKIAAKLILETQELAFLIEKMLDEQQDLSTTVFPTILPL